MKQPIHTQYTDLYTEHQDLVCQGAPDVLNARRPIALEVLNKMGLPKLGQEYFQHTDVEKLFEHNYGLNLSRIDLSVPANQPHYSCYLSLEDLTIKSSALNDDYSSTVFENQKRKLPQSVFAGSIKEFVQTYPNIAEQYYGKAAEEDTDGTVALNTLLVQDAFVLYVPQGIEIDQPIHLVQLLRSRVDLMCNRRWLIILEKGAKAEILVCDHALDEVSFLVNQIVEIFVDEEASLSWYDMEETSRNTHRISSTFLRQKSRSQVVIAGLTLNNGTTRNNYRARFLGTHASLTIGGLGIGGEQQSIDNMVRVEHTQPECSSNQLFKYILNDESKGAFAGRIFVASKAQQTDAYQNNRNLLLSPKAQMHSKPQLEIYADDVKCTHGLTTGQLDADALFFLKQRGISDSLARIMLSIAFAEDVIALIPIETLRDKIHQVIESRFTGQKHLTCGKCGKLIY